MEKKKILAIDDSVAQLTTYQGILSSTYTFRAAKSASEAMSFLNSNLADLVLLDIEMPNISGFEFLGDIRKIPSYMDVPIIIVSGNTEEGFLAQARNSRANDVLIKPVKAEDLINSIEKALAALG